MPSSAPSKTNSPQRVQISYSIKDTCLLITHPRSQHEGMNSNYEIKVITHSKLVSRTYIRTVNKSSSLPPTRKVNSLLVGFSHALVRRMPLPAAIIIPAAVLAARRSDVIYSRRPRRRTLIRREERIFIPVLRAFCGQTLCADAQSVFNIIIRTRGEVCRPDFSRLLKIPFFLC